MAFCSNCGNKIGDGMNFCPVCGAKVAAEAQEPVRVQYAEPAAPVYASAPAEPVRPVYTETSKPAEHPEKAEADAKIEATFGKALAATICAAFPIASIVAIVLGKQALDAWVEASDAAKRGGFRLTGKSVAVRVLGLVGKIGGIVMTAFWAIYFIVLIAVLAYAI